MYVDYDVGQNGGQFMIYVDTNGMAIAQEWSSEEWTELQTALVQFGYIWFNWFGASPIPG